MTTVNEAAAAPVVDNDAPVFHRDILLQEFHWRGLRPSVLDRPAVQKALELNRKGFLAEDTPGRPMVAKSLTVVRPLFDDPVFPNGAGIDYQQIPLRQASDSALQQELQSTSDQQIEACVAVANRGDKMAKIYAATAVGLGLASGFGAYLTKSQFDKASAPPTSGILAQQTEQAKINCDLKVAQNQVPALQKNVLDARSGGNTDFHQAAKQLRTAHEVCVPTEIAAIQMNRADGLKVSGGVAGVGTTVALVGAFLAARSWWRARSERHEYENVAGTKIVNRISIEADSSRRFHAAGSAVSVTASEPA